MTNKEIYEIMQELGMVENFSELDKLLEQPSITDAEYFDKEITTDPVKTINFVSDLFNVNDQYTIEKFLIAVLLKNK